MMFSLAMRATLLVACFICLQGTESKSVDMEKSPPPPESKPTLARSTKQELLKRLLKTEKSPPPPESKPTLARSTKQELLKRLLKTIELQKNPTKTATMNEPSPSTLNKKSAKTATMKEPFPSKRHVMELFRTSTMEQRRLSSRSSKVEYDIYVYTGDKWGAGTDADVYIVLYGADGQTGDIELNNPGDDFESGDMDMYSVNAEVGDLTKIVIWHDDSGWGSGWFLDKIVIESPDLGKKWEFLCGRWLADDEDDGALSRELYPTDSSENGDPTCGIPAITPKSGYNRIVGGEEATPHSWPWQVSLRNPSYWHFCGGTIISKRWVVTAAHCVPDGDASGLTVMVGDHDQDESDGETRLDVKRIIVHENYNTNNMQNDIALIELDEDVPWGQYVTPACLPSSEVAVDQECVVTGWGETEGTGDSTKLQQVKVPVVSNSVCTNSYGSSYITNVNVCAGYDDGGKDSCQGDSGGPMVCRPTGVYVLHGVVSWGSGCADAGYYGVYARVSELVSWVQENTGYAGQMH